MKKKRKHLKFRFKMAAILFRLLLMAPFLFIIFCLSYLPGSFGFTDYKMRNPDITSTNNVHKTNASSFVMWGKGPKVYIINLSDQDGFDSLAGLFQMARNFIYTAIRGRVPVEIYKEVTRNFRPIENIERVINAHSGLIMAMIVGVLFIVIFPFIGFGLAIGRHHGRFGGEMIQYQDELYSSNQKWLTIVLFIGIVFSFTGTVFMFASDTRLLEKLRELPNILPKVMDNLAIYGSRSYSELKFIGNETIDFLLNVVQRDLSNLDVLVGMPLRDELEKQAKTEFIFSSLRKLQNSIVDMELAMRDLDRNIQALEKSVVFMRKAMGPLKSRIDLDYYNCKVKKYRACLPNNLVTLILTNSFSAAKLPDINNNIRQMRTIDLVSKIPKPKKDFDEIPEVVYNTSKTNVKNIKNLLDDARKILPAFMNRVKQFKIDLENGDVAGWDLRLLQNKSQGFINIIKPYQILSNTFVMFACLCLFIVGLLATGFGLGYYGHDDSDSPVERNDISDRGGFLLMAAVYVIFGFGSILMMLTTTMFIPGSIAEVYGCKTLRNIGEGSIDYILKEILNTNFGERGFGNKTFNITVKEIYNACDKGAGLYKAARLSNIANLDDIFYYPKNHGVKKELTNIHVDLKHIRIMEPSLLTELANFRKSIAIDFYKYSYELSKIQGRYSLRKLISMLDALNNLVAPFGKRFIDHARYVRLIEANELNQVSDDKDKVLDNLADLRNKTRVTVMILDRVHYQMLGAQDLLDNNGAGTVKAVFSKFGDRILGIWDGCVKYIENLLNYKIIKCKPLVNIYNYAILETGCGTIDSFNAYWFGLGWCLTFFVINLILAVKLSKFYRRMEYLDDQNRRMHMYPQHRSAYLSAPKREPSRESRREQSRDSRSEPRVEPTWNWRVLPKQLWKKISSLWFVLTTELRPTASSEKKVPPHEPWNMPPSHSRLVINEPRDVLTSVPKQPSDEASSSSSTTPTKPRNVLTSDEREVPIETTSRRRVLQKKLKDLLTRYGCVPQYEPRSASEQGEASTQSFETLTSHQDREQDKQSDVLPSTQVVPKKTKVTFLQKLSPVNIWGAITSPRRLSPSDQTTEVPSRWEVPTPESRYASIYREEVPPSGSRYVSTSRGKAPSFEPKYKQASREEFPPSESRYKPTTREEPPPFTSRYAPTFRAEAPSFEPKLKPKKFLQKLSPVNIWGAITSPRRLSPNAQSTEEPFRDEVLPSESRYKQTTRQEAPPFELRYASTSRGEAAPSESRYKPTTREETPPFESRYASTSRGEVPFFESRYKPTTREETPPFESRYAPTSRGEVPFFESRYKPTTREETPPFESRYAPTSSGEVPSFESKYKPKKFLQKLLPVTIWDAMTSPRKLSPSDQTSEVPSRWEVPPSESRQTSIYREEVPLSESPYASTSRGMAPSFEPKYKSTTRQEIPPFESRYKPTTPEETPPFESRYKPTTREETPPFESRYKPKTREETPPFESRYKPKTREETAPVQSRYKSKTREETPPFESRYKPTTREETPPFESRYKPRTREETPPFESRYKPKTREETAPVQSRYKSKTREETPPFKSRYKPKTREETPPVESRYKPKTYEETPRFKSRYKPPTNLDVVPEEPSSSRRDVPSPEPRYKPTSHRDVSSDEPRYMSTSRRDVPPYKPSQYLSPHRGKEPGNVKTTDRGVSPIVVMTVPISRQRASPNPLRDVLTSNRQGSPNERMVGSSWLTPDSSTRRDPFAMPRYYPKK